MYVGLEGGCTCLWARIRIVLGMAGHDRKEGCACLLAWIVLGMAGSDRKEGHACLLAWIVMGMAGSSAWP